YIMLTWYRQADFAEDLVALPNCERRTERFVIANMVCRNVRLRRQPVGYAPPFNIRDYQLNIRIVKANYRRTEKWDFVDEIGKALNDIVHAFVRFHMLFVDICHDRDCREEH